MFFRSFFSLCFLIVFFLPTLVFAHFTDIQKSPFREAIESLEQQKVLSGFEDGSFHPEAKINRAEALKMIFLASKVEVPEVSGWSGFSDVPEKMWFTKFVVRARQLSIIKGTKKQVFSPAAAISYAEALKMIMKLNGIFVPDTVQNDPFPDVSAKTWHAPYFFTAKNLKLIQSNPVENIFPDKALSRGELAALLYQMQKVVNMEGREIGIATFYRTKFERLHPDDNDSSAALTTAHKTFPFGTKLKVTALDSGKSIIVTVQDRGPFGVGRVVDLSRSAFSKIAPLSQGVVPVLVELVR